MYYEHNTWSTQHSFFLSHSYTEASQRVDSGGPSSFFNTLPKIFFRGAFMNVIPPRKRLYG
jgi:hypothetical protein